MEMKDWGYEPKGFWQLPRLLSWLGATPVFHVYRIYSHGLNLVQAQFWPAVRTPFNSLLDAAGPIWVLPRLVTYRGHSQTAKR